MLLKCHELFMKSVHYNSLMSLFQGVEKQSVDRSHSINTLASSKFKSSVCILVLFLFWSVLLKVDHLLFLVTYWSRDLAQNKLSGEIPRLIYWNEVLQYLWVVLSGLKYGKKLFGGNNLDSDIFFFRGLRGNNLVGSLSPDMCQLSGLWYLWVVKL